MDFDLPNAYISKEMKEAFDLLIHKEKPDVIICEYAVLAQLISKSPSYIKKICDTHDCFTNRNKRLRAQGINKPWLNLTARQEKSLLKHFDHIWAIQCNEMKQLAAVSGDAQKVSTLDIVSPSDLTNNIIPTNEHIGYIGSYNPQNLKGLVQFIEYCWPIIIAQRPNAKLLIAGNICNEIFLKPSQTHSVLLLGLVDTLSDFYEQTQLIA